MRGAFVVALTLFAAACDASPAALPSADMATLGPLVAMRDHACACKDAGCAYRVLGEMFAYADAHRELRDSLEADSLATETARCLHTASRAAPDAAPDAGVTQVTGMPACDEYLALVERYLQCSQFPQAARDSTRQATDQMRQAWADMANLPPDVRRTADDACRQATDAMRQAGQAMGCDLTRPPP